MNIQSIIYPYRCPKLECGAKYFATTKDEAPDKKPRCIECDTPFLAKDNGRYIHYFLDRLNRESGSGLGCRE
jgi:hypothetical protein